MDLSLGSFPPYKAQKLISKKRRNWNINPISDGSSIHLVFVLAPTLVAMPVGDARPTGI